MKARLVIDVGSESEGKFTVVLNKTGINIFPDKETDISYFSADVIPLIGIIPAPIPHMHDPNNMN